MDRDRDDFSGRFTREYPVRQFKEAVVNSDGLSTQGVADKVGCSRDLAYRRLKELEERGEVRVERVGGSFQWFLLESENED